MRVVLCGGGTGGHIYPALSVLAALKEDLEVANVEALYLGQGGGMEETLVKREGVPFCPIPSGPVRGCWPWEMAANFAKIAVGIWQARKQLRLFSAQVVLSTGGYASIPIALAAWSMDIPLVVFQPDLLPGWAIRLMGHLATKIAIPTPEASAKWRNGKVTVTGYPVRPFFWMVDKEEGRRRLGLEMDEGVLLVMGASQGAKSINEAVAHWLPELLELCQVVHISGPAHFDWLRERSRSLSAQLQLRYHLYPYMHEELPWAMAAADLAITRAGASVLGELPAVGLPAILVPYPYAGGHQWHNAHYLEAEGAAIVVADKDLKRKLLPLVGILLSDVAKRAKMAMAMRRLARPHAAQHLASLLLEVVGQR